MSRPEYRTLKDEKLALLAARTYGKQFECSVYPNPRYHLIDYTAVRTGRIVALLGVESLPILEIESLLEIKGKDHNASTFPTADIDLIKWIRLVQVPSRTGLKTELIFAFNDRPMYADVLSLKPLYGYGGRGRKWRGDSQDKMPVALIPIDQLDRSTRGIVDA